MRRKIYNKLLEWKSNDENKKPLMVLGVRQCGKTYVIKDFCKNEFENVCVINLLERDDILELFSRSINSEEKYNILKTMTLSPPLQSADVPWDFLEYNAHLRQLVLRD